MKYWKIVENLNDVSNQLFSSIYVNFLRIQTDGIIKWNHQPCPFCQMRQVHQTISCHLQFLYSSENIPINIINQHANPKIKFSSHVHEHIKKKRFSERGKKSNHKACQFWSSCHHWPQPWKKRSFWQEKAGLWLLSSQHWKEMVSSSMSSSLRLPFQSSSIFFSPSFLPSWSDFFRCCFFCICSGNTKTTTRGSDNEEDKWQWVCGWAVDMMLQHYHYLLNSFNHFWRHQRSTYLYVPAYVLKTCGHGPTLRRLTFCSLSL